MEVVSRLRFLVSLKKRRTAVSANSFQRNETSVPVE